MREFYLTLDKLPQAWKEDIARNHKAVISALRDTAIMAKVIVQEQSPVDQGLFKEGWSVINLTDGAMLMNDAPHAVFVEDGTRPHWPPPEPIKQWLIRKLKIIGKAKISEGLDAPLTTKTGRARSVHRRKGVIVSSDQEIIDRITFLICRKISIEGTKPHHILKNNSPKFLVLMHQQIIKHLTAGR